MLPIILHSREAKTSRDFVAANPDQTVIDWFDFEARRSLLDIVGDVVVRSLPPVLIGYPAWFTPPTSYGDERVDHPAGFEVVDEPESWEAVEAHLAFVKLRTHECLPGVDVPEVEAIVWGDVPEPPKGQVALFDGWDVEGGVARRRWRFEEAPEQVFEEETDVSDDDE